MATAATMLPHICGGPLQPLLDSIPGRPPRRPQHTSAPSRPLLLLFLASLGYFQFCVFLLLYNLCSLLFLHHHHHLSTEVSSPKGTRGRVSDSLALEQGLFSPGPRCVVEESSCGPSCLDPHWGCCGREEDAAVLPLRLQPAPAQEQVAVRGDLPGQQKKEIKHRKGECHSM